MVKIRTNTYLILLITLNNRIMNIHNLQGEGFCKWLTGIEPGSHQSWMRNHRLNYSIVHNIRL